MRGPREKMLGAWQLATFETHDTETGGISRPFGTSPSGLILYTADGYMSAQICAPGIEFISYGGPFHVDEQTSVVHHDVMISTMADLLESPQYRT